MRAESGFFGVLHDLAAQVECKDIEFRLRNGAGLAHDNQLMPTVGALIRRMNVLIVVLHIAAARIKIPTAKRNIIHQWIDFQNDGFVVLLGKRTQNQRAESLTAQVWLDRKSVV